MKVKGIGGGYRVQPVVGFKPVDNSLGREHPQEFNAQGVYIGDRVGQYCGEGRVNILA